MNFNSIEFALFLPIVFIIYWYGLRNKLKSQNAFLLLASYLFYGWWNWQLLGLIMFTTASTFLTALGTEKFASHRRLLTGLNIAINLLILCTFKYLDFFGESFARLFQQFGYEVDWVTLDLILPIGISFYTFQAIGYSIDVYRRTLRPTHDAIAFATFIAFFPQLVAGPIERATNLLPQVLSPRRWDYAQAVVGMRQILWGLVKKLAVADLCGQYADTILSQPDFYGSSSLVWAIVLFSFQIYGDFSGYSDIAIGTSRLFGFKLMDNFRYPYFATSISDFWRRWHISLMTWLRDYIYIPLGGSRRGSARTLLNIAIVFLLSGLWHGANWTFVIWGAYWAVLMIAERLMRRRIVLVFLFVVGGWMIFRSPDIEYMSILISNICDASILELPTGLTPIVLIVPLLIIEWIGRHHTFPLERMAIPTWARWSVYWLLLGVILWSVDGSTGEFIYFQF